MLPGTLKKNINEKNNAVGIGFFILFKFSRTSFSQYMAVYAFMLFT